MAAQLEDGPAPALAALHRVPPAARHHRPHSTTSSLAHDLVPGQELVAADDQHGARQDVELDEQLLDPALAVHLDLLARIAKDDLHDAGKSRAAFTARSCSR